MKATLEFFNQLSKEISENPNPPLYIIANRINERGRTDLDTLLKEKIDWHSLPSEEIVPRECVRNLIKEIQDKETRVQVAKFLHKYADYYFHDIEGVVGTEEREDWMERTYTEDIIGIVYSIEDFRKELSVLIEQMESEGEFSVKLDKIKAENLEMKKQMDAIAEVFNLKTREDWANFDQAINRWQENSQVIERLQSEKAALLDYIKEQTAQLLLLESAPITIDQICEYAKEYLDRSERQIISHMLLNIIENPDKDTRAKIKALDKKTPLDAQKVVLGDDVQTKIVKS